jgi:hypothetical protein
VKKICCVLSVLFLVSSLCFPGGMDFNRSLRYWPLGTEGFEFTPSLFEFDSSYLAQKLRDIEQANSLQRTGHLLIFGGGLLAVMGSIFFIGSKKFGGVCCEQKYRNWGYLFIGTGSAMFVSGLIMTSKGKKIEGGLSLHVNPHLKEAALGCRLVF